MSDSPARAAGAPTCALRRRLLQGGAALALAPLARHAGAADVPADKQAPQVGDLLAFPSWENDGRPLTAGDLELHAEPLLAYPLDAASGTLRERSRLNQILVLRFAEDELAADTRALAADGVLATSGICTHTACGITGWDDAALHLVCPCHQSTFDPRHHGTRVSGPAPRSLPLLPIRREGEHFVVAGDFTSAVGANT
ncbi:MAG: Rieske 2Fe-2S domain-containing protein [Gammaproteobacteria bacterium]|nr:Rieske 2Fe-2S domain-containing protein [Gammaproteobacteria bacterium]MCP5199899.1 Rieske 2Fe-2S domain-containing protein [Gammaproteobacteria bacterium]